MTPDFSSWAQTFRTQVHRLRTTTGATLHQFEALFSPWIPRHRLAQQEQKAHSRDRCWNLRLVFWTFLWQVAQVGSSCREAIRQAQSSCRLNARSIPPDETSPYCQSRGNIPLEVLRQIHQGVVDEAEEAVAQKDRWCGHRVLAVDGSTVTSGGYPRKSETLSPSSRSKNQAVASRSCAWSPCSAWPQA